MPKVSVVVPVYNVEPYLALCIDSLRNQSLTDIEIICVDDGSTDRSVQILELLDAVDDRIRVITIANEGVSVARNTGIDAATGEVICFVDADDAAKPDMCRLVYDAIMQNDADIVKFSGEVFPPINSNPWLDETLTLEPAVFEGFSEELVFDKPSRPFPWNGGYRASFLKEKNIRFVPGLPLGEDQAFSFATLGRSSKTVFIPQKLYSYRQTRNDSATAIAEEDKVGRLLKHLDVVGAILVDWRAGGLLERCPKRMLDFVCSFLLEDICILDSDEQRDAVLRELSVRMGEWYGLDELKSLCGARQWALLERVVNYDGDPSFLRERAVYDVVEALHGKRAAIDRKSCDLRHKILDPLYQGLRKVLPMPSASALGYMVVQRNLIEDGMAATRAIELLRLEAASKRGGAR